jgi:hypothetical protein
VGKRLLKEETAFTKYLLKNNMKTIRNFVQIQKKIDEAFASEPINRNLFVDIISEIHSIIPSLNNTELEDLKSIYVKLRDDLFDKSTSLPEINISIFDRPQIKLVDQKIEEVKVDLEIIFSKKLKDIIDCIKDTNSIMRRSIFIRADSNIATDFKIIILHDQYSKYPFHNKINTKFDDDIITYRLDEMNRMPKATFNSDYSYIIFIILSPNSFKINKIDDLINDLANEFKLQKIDLDFSKLNDEDFYTLTGDTQEILEELKYVTDIELINSKMTSEESNILRKLFRDEGFYALEYSVLGGGFTNSSVYLIKKHGLMSNCFKSVVKIGNKADKTLTEEQNNFKQFVKHIDKDYTITPEKTESLVAICYNYGSSDANSPASPFSEIYHKNELPPREIIDKLFSIKLMQEWLNTIDNDQIKVSEAYKNHINNSKIYPVIYEITDKEDKELIETIDTILNFSLKLKKKVCHGDLHSDNFLYDGKEVFLIDFGHTGVYHSLIDHTTLECAIKFRHIPKYISINELIEIEKELLELNSFSGDYKFSNIKRSDLYKPFQTINHIRCLATPLFRKPDEHLEYLFSLFAITLRQIRYPDVNQRYALECTRLLANHLISKI